MSAVAPVIELTLLPRSPEFSAELDSALHVLIPSAMSRLNEAGAEAIREPVLMSCATLDGHVRRLQHALEIGEPDSFATEAALHGFWLYKSAVEHWRDADPANRWPGAA